MALVFIWRPEGPAAEEARRRFRTELDTFASKAAVVAKRSPFKVRTTVQGDLLAGMVDTDYGLEGYRPWCESDRATVLFSGVCETFLGEDPSRVADEMSRLAWGHDRELAGLEGRFSAVVLDKGSQRTGVITGAVDVSSLWMTEGPAGWALGSRAAPLLRLVERRATVDPVSAGLVLSFGYLRGADSLFRGVSRVHARSRVCVDRHGPPRAAPYLALASFLGDVPTATFEESVAASAEQLKLRVARQLKHSPRPLISLSGGVDSRCIAAALDNTGTRVPAYTSGALTSAEVVHAREAAESMGLPWIAPGLSREDALAQENSFAQCLDWSELSEGVESIRHVLSVPDLFFGGKPVLGNTLYQVFHGHGGNTYHAPYYGRLYPDQRRLERPGTEAQLAELFRPAIPHRLRNHDEVEEQLRVSIAAFAEEVRGMELPLARWFDLYYWHDRCLVWGDDIFAAKDLLGWHWSPLMDRELLRMNVAVECAPWTRFGFMERVVKALAPRAAACRYVGSSMSRSRRWSRRLRRMVPRGVRPYAGRAAALVRGTSGEPVGGSLSRFWEEVFSEADVLDAVIPRDVLQHVLETRPTSPLLWNAATVALTARRCLSDTA